MPLAGLDRRSELRERRFKLQAANARISLNPRHRQCGRVGVLPGGSVVIRSTTVDGVATAGFANLSTCASPWACAVCAAKIAARKRTELAAMVEAHCATGGEIAMGTYTIPHRQTQALTTGLDGLAYAWGRASTGRAWLRDVDQFGVFGWSKHAEVTIGNNGWHAHLHVLLFLLAGAGEATAEQLGTAMYGRWSAAAVSKGFRRPLKRAQDMHLVIHDQGELADYVTKGGMSTSTKVALELTGSQSKTARGAYGTVPHWEVLEEAANGTKHHVVLWHEFVAATAGRRSTSTSRGLRDSLGVGPAMTDEDAAAEQLGTSRDDVLLIRADQWALLIALGPVVKNEVLRQYELGGLHQLCRFLDGHGVAYEFINERQAA